MIYLYLFGTCFHFIYVFMIIGNNSYHNTTKRNIIYQNKFSKQESGNHRKKIGN